MGGYDSDWGIWVSGNGWMVWGKGGGSGDEGGRVGVGC